MGIPKFFRYISERYPCLSEVVRECEIPEFDNLYLDMNGIIHNCSHPNDFDPHFRITEEKIFKDIFHYIEMLFRIIKPRQLFFMAVDGVAPRAKMNQQRGRRFRSAKDMIDKEKRVIQKGENLPTEDRFDSNCITPGTVFMHRLQAQLKYFVSFKVSTDVLWQQCTVVLSGQEVPGEGEHKIMEYIRYLRTTKTYESNTRHCLYGLDADLIMLGLCSHEPYFSLLREEVKFGKHNSKKIAAPQETKFYLLHLSLLREYIGMEFQELKEPDVLSFEFNLEKIIDDWILMSFLVGNDFIPHLPNLHIHGGALPLLYNVYKEVLPKIDGYLNQDGKLNLKRFGVFMKKLGLIDVERFKEIIEDTRYLQSKRSSKQAPLRELVPATFLLEKMETKNGGKIVEEALEETSTAEGNEEEKLLEMLANKRMEDSSSAPDDVLKAEGEGEEVGDDDEEVAILKEFVEFKKLYYQTKLHIQNVTPQVLSKQALGYLEAIQWNLYYYYEGVCSWSWYFPHHYTPFTSDIQGFEDMKFEFKLGKPFLPFQQLLAVLPPQSKQLLPDAYHFLMTDPDSQIIDYYPSDFATDLNNKKHDWEALVLIPFIEEGRLVSAMETRRQYLTEDEIERNKMGPMYFYHYTKNSLGRYEAPDYFPALSDNHAKETKIERKEIVLKKQYIKKGLLPGAAKLEHVYGFPTFHHIPYFSELEKTTIKRFGGPTKTTAMVVTLNGQPNHELAKVAANILGRLVHVQWPYLIEARVCGVSDGSVKYVQEEGAINVFDLTEDMMSDFNLTKKALVNDLMLRRGIRVLNSSILAYVRLVDGQKHVLDVDNRVILDKMWSTILTPVLLETVVSSVVPRYVFTPSQDLDEYLTPGTLVFMVTKPYYGYSGKVEEVTRSRVKVKVTCTPEPDISSYKEKNRQYIYHPGNIAAGKVGMTPHLLSRITGSILVTDRFAEGDSKRINIGLNLKFNTKNEEVVGYTKKREPNQWLYSDRTVSLVVSYAQKFPKLFEYLIEHVGDDVFTKEDMFPDSQQSTLIEITQWINSLPISKAERRRCGSSSLDPELVIQLERRIDSFLFSNLRCKNVSVKARANLVHKPSPSIDKSLIDPTVNFRLLDRVVNVRDSYIVPVGLRGTVIGIEESVDSDSYRMCDVMFDQPFASGLKINCEKPRAYRVPVQCLMNLTFYKCDETQKPPSGISILSNNRNRKNPNTSNSNNNSSNNIKIQDNASKIIKQLPLTSSENSLKIGSSKIEPPKSQIPSTSKNITSTNTLIEEDSTNFLKKMLNIMDNGKQLVPDHGNLLEDLSLHEPELTPTERLNEYYVKRNLRLPLIDIRNLDGKFIATIELPTNQVVTGTPAPTRHQASDNAAHVILAALGEFHPKRSSGLRNHLSQPIIQANAQQMPAPTPPIMSGLIGGPPTTPMIVQSTSFTNQQMTMNNQIAASQISTANNNLPLATSPIPFQQSPPPTAVPLSQTNAIGQSVFVGPANVNYFNASAAAYFPHSMGMAVQPRMQAPVYMMANPTSPSLNLQIPPSNPYNYGVTVQRPTMVPIQQPQQFTQFIQPGRNQPREQTEMYKTPSAPRENTSNPTASGNAAFPPPPMIWDGTNVGQNNLLPTWDKTQTNRPLLKPNAIPPPSWDTVQSVTSPPSNPTQTTSWDSGRSYATNGAPQVSWGQYDSKPGSRSEERNNQPNAGGRPPYQGPISAAPTGGGCVPVGGGCSSWDSTKTNWEQAQASTGTSDTSAPGWSVLNAWNQPARGVDLTGQKPIWRPTDPTVPDANQGNLRCLSRNTGGPKRTRVVARFSAHVGNNAGLDGQNQPN